MKKIGYLVLIIVLSFVFVSNVYAKDKVEIKSIELDSKSPSTRILNDVTTDGLEISFDLGFVNVDDYAKYKIVLKNNTNEEYTIAEDIAFEESDYIGYTYEINGKLLPNDEQTVYLNIYYKNLIEDELITDKSHNETNKLVLKILNKNGEVVNPKTGVYSIPTLLIIVIVLAIVGFIYIVKTKKISKFSTLVFVLFLFIPMIVYATTSSKITMGVKAKISQEYFVMLSYEGTLLFTDEDLNTTPIGGTCQRDYYTYFGSSPIGYHECNNVSFFQGTYIEGEKINLSSSNYKRTTGNSFCSQSGNDYYCPESGIADYSLEYMYYYLDYQLYCVKSDMGNSCIPVRSITGSSMNILPSWVPDRDTVLSLYQKDLSVMMFSSIAKNKWEDEKYIIVGLPQSFTMPSHNVSLVMAPDNPIVEYSVNYVIPGNILTEEETENLEFYKDGSCQKVIFTNENETYYICNSYIVKDEKTYAPYDEVTTKSITVKGIYDPSQHCSTSNNVLTCDSTSIISESVIYDWKILFEGGYGSAYPSFYMGYSDVYLGIVYQNSNA